MTNLPLAPRAESEYKNQATDSMSINQGQKRHKWYYNLKYLWVGLLFGVLFVKAEVISWFRIQEMFRLQAFHMYGIIGSAVLVGMISVWLIKRYGIKTISGEAITFTNKKFNKGQIYGGLLFGLGWGLTGACPGPLFAQIGMGATIVFVTLISAIAGTWVYGKFRDQLPH
ncbi:transporter [Dyadobacter flavalbus]|uniref:Transporter n=3 Tax=Spirosomataceae TaxID=2896860 RepID=A0A5R9KMF3_9BACT|nr:transporter [Dyadobacter flavalbus]TLU97394.1 transporter [Dyadobacter sediminis]GGC15667.1 transporter [Dyadobacter sediminis]